jgi:hypothetical protein
MAASGLAIGSAVALSVPEPELVLRDVPTEGPFPAAVIIRAIRNAPVGPDDALMLYYGGHGAYDEPHWNSRPDHRFTDGLDGLGWRGKPVRVGSSQSQ